MPRLTLSMIVKNEEKYLRECLESAKGIVDEIVIVDTGSTDRTIEIAKEFGAKLFYFDWIDDFSAARNYALSKSSGKWILFLDADERLDQSSQQELREIVSLSRKLGCFCFIKSANTETKKESIISGLRLFSNSKGIEFTGKVHEQISPSLILKGYEITNSNVIINHVGYDVAEESMNQKAKRNLILLLKEYEKNPLPYYASKLGETYRFLKENELACRYSVIAEESIDLPPDQRATAFSILAAISIENKMTEEAISHIEKALRLNDKSYSYYLLASKIYTAKKDIDEAEKLCRKSYSVFKEMKSTFNAAKDESYLIANEIIYFGLMLAIQNNNQDNFNFYMEIVKNVDRLTDKNGQLLKMLDVIKKIWELKPLEEEEKKNIAAMVDSDNLCFILSKIDKYPDVNLQIELLQNIDSKIPNSIEVIKRLAKACGEKGEYSKAVELIENAIAQNYVDPAAYFYLISFYIQDARYEKAILICDEIEKRYPNIGELVNKATALKERLLLNLSA